MLLYRRFQLNGKLGDQGVCGNRKLYINSNNDTVHCGRTGPQEPTQFSIIPLISCIQSHMFYKNIISSKTLIERNG